MLRLPGRVLALAAAAIAIASVVASVISLRPNPRQPATSAENAKSSNSIAAETRPEEAGASSSVAAGPPRDIRSGEQGPDDFQPARLYREYKDEAEAGNVNAQYVLATALQECLNIARSEDALEQAIAELPTEFAESARHRFRRCKPLAGAAGEFDRWFQAALAGRHPLLVAKQQNRPADEQQALIRQALVGPYPEPYLYAEAYGAAARFYRDYPEHQDKIREEAWLSLSCTSSYHCDADRELEELKTRVHTHEYEQILTMIGSFKQAIEREAWDDLGF